MRSPLLSHAPFAHHARIIRFTLWLMVLALVVAFLTS